MRRMSDDRRARRSRTARARSAITLVRVPPSTISALMLTPRRPSFHLSIRVSCAASSYTALMPSSGARPAWEARSEEHTSELQSRGHLVCRLLLEKKKKRENTIIHYKKRQRD